MRVTDPSDTMSMLSSFGDVVVVPEEVTNEGGSDMRPWSDVSSRTYGPSSSSLLREVVDWKKWKRLADADATFVLMSRSWRMALRIVFMMAKDYSLF